MEKSVCLRGTGIVKEWISDIYETLTPRSNSDIKPRSHLDEYLFPIVQDRDKFSEQYETNRNDEYAIHVTNYPNVFPIIWRYIATVSEQFTDTLLRRQDS